LIRQRALEARLQRAARSIEAGGLLDPRTGLLTEAAFSRDLSRSIEDAHAQGAGLSVASFTLSTHNERSRFDAARIVSQLMRRMDFGTLQSDGTIVVAFAGTSIVDARSIARRLASVLKQTAVGPKPNGRLTSDVAVTSLLPNDSESSLLARLRLSEAQAAS
jgi:GGDEF domain-containing protein